jgi:hypothetical protein
MDDFKGPVRLKGDVRPLIASALGLQTDRVTTATVDVRDGHPTAVIEYRLSVRDYWRMVAASPDTITHADK